MAWKGLAFWNYRENVAISNNIQDIANKFTEYFNHGGRVIQSAGFVKSQIKLLSSSATSAIRLTIRSSSHLVSSADKAGIDYPNNAEQAPGINRVHLSGELDKTIGLFEQSWFSRGSGPLSNNFYLGFKRGALFCDYEVAQIEDEVRALMQNTFIWQDKD